MKISYKIIIVALCVIIGLFAIVASIRDFLLYSDGNIESRTQTVQGGYNSYENIRRTGKYGATRKEITVDNQTYRIITIADFDEESFLNNVEAGDFITLVIDFEDQIILSVADQNNHYLSLDSSLKAIKMNASIGIIVGLSFLSMSLIGVYLMIFKKNKYKRKRKRKKRSHVKWC